MIKVGTDFSGIGSPEAALKRLGIPHQNIFACDIDKYAKKSFLELNNPIEFYDDITTRNYKDVPKLDLYVAGFPCQSFSLAGKRGGFDDTRGTLFFNVAEFIKVNQPNCFILENVKGLLSHDSGKTYQTITDVLTNGGGTLNGQMGMDTIEDGLGYHVYTKVLNTKDYGVPQNRERIFIVGFKYWREFRFPKPFELKLKLKDILEEDVNEKYYLSVRAIQGIKNSTYETKKSIIQNEICATLLSRDYKDPKCIKVHSLYPRSSKTGKGGTGHLSKEDGTVYCVDTGNAQAIEIKGAALRGRGEGKELEVRKDNLVNSITTVQTDSIIKENNQIIEWVADYRNDEGLRIRKDNNTPCLTASKNSETELSRMPPIIKQNNIRRLTPLECWRLQGFTDEEFYKAQKVNSDTQLYKQAGNSITVNVITLILKKIYLS
jgi:DNA (cytosine-5)-methyltransferase 1|tara:strand:- start:2962 stop:4260 length:1299 start_codon:yes stop_codon:yes gene_type:complete